MSALLEPGAESVSKRRTLFYLCHVDCRGERGRTRTGERGAALRRGERRTRGVRGDERRTGAGWASLGERAHAVDCTRCLVGSRARASSCACRRLTLKGCTAFSLSLSLSIATVSVHAHVRLSRAMVRSVIPPYSGSTPLLTRVSTASTPTCSRGRRRTSRPSATARSTSAGTRSPP